MARVLLSIKPDLMRWARASAGISAAAAAEHFELTESELSAWESTGAEVTPRQLEGIADFYKRSTAVFFLPAPPTEPPTPADFRVAPGMAGPLDRKTLFALRQARRLQRVYLELREELGNEPLAPLPSIRLSEDPGRAAREMRALLGVTVEDQIAWGTPGKALRGWKRALESLGVLVFQESLPDAQGFSLPGAAPVILLNMKHNTPTRRMFTLFHELAHLCLGQPGICAPDTRVRQQPAIEFFCNAFAGNALVPEEALRDREEIRWLQSGERDLLAVLNRLAKALSASREVVLRRLRDTNLVSRADFDAMQRHLAATAGHGDDGGGFVSWPEKRLNRLGGRFVRTVLEAHERGIASSADLTDYLGLKGKYIGVLHDLLVAA